jgi:outer membrane autotransporter protein
VSALVPGGHDDRRRQRRRTGKRFAAFGPWALTPQAPLSYASVDLDFPDAFGAEVSTRNGDSLLGRLGVALDYRTCGSVPARIANLYYEFLDGTSIDVSGRDRSDMFAQRG